MGILIGILVGIISLFVPLVIEQGRNLSLLDVNSFQENITFLYSEFSSYLNDYNINLDNTITVVPKYTIKFPKWSLDSITIELYNIKQIDIINSNKEYHYQRITSSIDNYSSIFRKKFQNLSTEIVDSL